jgi:CrcB protein
VKFLLIFLGGGLGSGLRYILSSNLLASQGISFPWPTFIVNLIGSFLLGVLITFFEKNLSYSREMMLLTTTGFCGGFTTFSTFSYENFYLLKNGNTTIMIFYILASVLGGLAAAWGGYLLASLK